MRIAYLTADEVNQALARRLARRCSASLFPWPLHGPAPDGQVDAVVYDLDYLPEPRRTEVLTRLSEAPPCHPAAVHSFNLTDHQIRALRANGVGVYHRLELRVFKMLSRNFKCPNAEQKVRARRGSGISFSAKKG
jgi:hypothetical protein